MHQIVRVARRYIVSNGFSTIVGRVLVFRKDLVLSSEINWLTLATRLQEIYLVIAARLGIVLHALRGIRWVRRGLRVLSV